MLLCLGHGRQKGHTRFSLVFEDTFSVNVQEKFEIIYEKECEFGRCRNKKTQYRTRTKKAVNVVVFLVIFAMKSIICGPNMAAGGGWG